MIKFIQEEEKDNTGWGSNCVNRIEIQIHDGITLDELREQFNAFTKALTYPVGPGELVLFDEEREAILTLEELKELQNNQLPDDIDIRYSEDDELNKIHEKITEIQNKLIEEQNKRTIQAQLNSDDEE